MQSRRRHDQSSCTSRSSAHRSTATPSWTGWWRCTTTIRSSLPVRRLRTSRRAHADAGLAPLRNLGLTASRKENAMAGKPVHFEVPAKDTSRAREFYGNLFGWQFQSMEGPVEYHMTRFSEDTGGAVLPGDPGAIRVYFEGDDVKAGVARVTELGGKADDPQPVPGMG